jgi:hypothetical protein
MYSIYTTEVFDDWFINLKTSRQKDAYKFELIGLKMEILEILSLLVKVFLNYVSFWSRL